jgi:type II secretory pathway predicted ATPase ExeA
MVTGLERERNIEDLGKHTTESVDRLRQLLAGGAQVYPDPKRPGFYEVESGSDVYYIHISPVSGKIFLLATWKIDLASESAGVHQAA